MFVMAIGTSICDMVVDAEEVRLPGITGVVRDGILPGLFGYEAGQAAVGDMLAWFVRTLGDGADFADLERAAAELEPGETGLVALDWFNGNRSILADADLSGSIIGLTLHTRPDEIYRALLESIAFGNRRIMDNFTEHGIALTEIVACGGIAEKSPLTMQLIADISGRPVHVPDSSLIPARGAALFAAVAAGLYDGIGAAIAATRPPDAHVYEPQAAATEVYDRVYADLPQPLRDARAHPGGAAARAQAHPNRKKGPMTQLPRIGLLGIMQELYDEMIPGITEHQAQYAAEVAQRLSDVAAVSFSRPARNQSDIQERVDELVAEGVDGIMIVMLTYGPAMRSVRALRGVPVPLMLANIQPERTITASWTMDDLTYNQGIHGAQDQANALLRAGVPCSIITADWRSDEFAEAFADWATAARAITTLRGAKVALLGYPMNGMGDILYDPPAMARRIGPTIIAEDLGGLHARLAGVTEAAVDALRDRARRAVRDRRPRSRPSVMPTRRGWRSRSARCWRRAATPAGPFTSTRSAATAGSPSCRCWPRPI